MTNAVLTQYLSRKGKYKGVSERDKDRLAEMVEYCEEEGACRRKVFASAFGGATDDPVETAQSTKYSSSSALASYTQHLLSTKY